VKRRTEQRLEVSDLGYEDGDAGAVCVGRPAGVVHACTHRYEREYAASGARADMKMQCERGTRRDDPDAQ